jgi:protein-S-isoprenylcysteine O-methyltransferase Ste14
VETVISGIVVAALSGLGFLAYKHPRAYKKLYWPLSIISLALFLGAIVWDKSNSTAHVAALPYIPREMLAEADKAITDKTFFGESQHPVYIGIGMVSVHLPWVRQRQGESRAVRPSGQSRRCL